MLILNYWTWNGKRPDETAGFRPQMKTLFMYFLRAFFPFFFIFSFSNSSAEIVEPRRPSAIPAHIDLHEDGQWIEVFVIKHVKHVFVSTASREA